MEVYQDKVSVTRQGKSDQPPNLLHVYMDDLFNAATQSKDRIHIPIISI